MTEQCKKHDFVEIFRTPTRGAVASAITSVLWCKECGTVSKDSSYYDPTTHHIKDEYIPNSLQHD